MNLMLFKFKLKLPVSSYRLLYLWLTPVLSTDKEIAWKCWKAALLKHVGLSEPDCAVLSFLCVYFCLCVHTVHLPLTLTRYRSHLLFHLSTRIMQSFTGFWFVDEMVLNIERSHRCNLTWVARYAVWLQPGNNAGKNGSEWQDGEQNVSYKTFKTDKTLNFKLNLIL